MKVNVMKKIPNSETVKALNEDVTGYPRYKMKEVEEMLNNFAGGKMVIEDNPDWKGWEIYDEIKCMLNSGEECPSLKELSEVFDLCHTSIGRYVNRLIEHGYLRRDENYWGRNIMLTDKTPDFLISSFSNEYDLISFIINNKSVINKYYSGFNKSYLYNFKDLFNMTFHTMNNKIIVRDENVNFGSYRILSHVFSQEEFTQLHDTIHEKAQIEFFNRIGYLE